MQAHFPRDMAPPSLVLKRRPRPAAALAAAMAFVALFNIIAFHGHGSSSFDSSSSNSVGSSAKEENGMTSPSEQRRRGSSDTVVVANAKAGASGKVNIKAMLRPMPRNVGGEDEAAAQEEAKHSEFLRQRQQEEWAKAAKGKKGVYTCGWDQGRLAQVLFPDYAFMGRLDATDPSPPPPSNSSVLVMGQNGLCRYPLKDQGFPGPTLSINGESMKMFSAKPARGKKSVRGYFGTASLIGQYSKEQWDSVFVPSKKARNTGERYLMYLVSRCFDHREDAFDRLSSIGRSPAYYGGECKGKLAASGGGGSNGTQHALQAPKGEVSPRDMVGLRARRAKDDAPPWRDNYLVFRKYRFCLVMENRNKKGYITEKIINAFLGGCVPIYYGVDEIFDIFNREAFIYYDPKHPEGALERVAYLEHNRSAYEEVLREPILAEGQKTIEEHFSYSDSIGGGVQKGRIRKMLGIVD